MVGFILPATISAELKVFFNSLKLLQLALDTVAYHSVIAASAVSLGTPFGKLFQKLTSNLCGRFDWQAGGLPFGIAVFKAMNVITPLP